MSYTNLVGRLYILLHSKDELIRTLHRYLHKMNTDEEIRNGTNHITFEIMQVTKMKYRAKGSIPCDPDLANDDSKWMYHVIKSIGCIPKYWEGFIKKLRIKGSEFPHVMSGFKICNSKNQYLKMISYFPLDDCGAQGMAKTVLDKFKRSCHQMRIMTATNVNKWKEDNILKLQFRYILLFINTY